MSIRRTPVLPLVLCWLAMACGGEDDPCSNPDSAGSPAGCVPGVEARVIAEVELDGQPEATELDAYPVKPFGDSVYFADPWGSVWRADTGGRKPTRVFDREGCAAEDLDVTADAVFAGLDCAASDGVSRLVRIDPAGGAPVVLRELTGAWFSRIHVVNAQVFYLSKEHPEAGVNATSATIPSELGPDEAPSGGLGIQVAPAAITFDRSTAYWSDGEMLARTELVSGNMTPLYMALGERGEVDVLKVDITSSYIYWQECAADGCAEDTRRIRRITPMPPATPELVLSGGFSPRALVHADVVYDVGRSILRWRTPDYEREVLAVGVPSDGGLAGGDGALFALGGFDGRGPARLTAITLGR